MNDDEVALQSVMASMASVFAESVELYINEPEDVYKLEAAANADMAIQLYLQAGRMIVNG